jgi:hypothetical protein
MYIQIDHKLIEAHLKKGNCIVRKMKYKNLRKKRKSNARQQHSNKYNRMDRGKVE